MALRTFFRILLSGIVCLLSAAATCPAGIDPVRLEHLGENKVPLSWNNIYGPPEIISRVASSLDKEHGHRFITFAPGQELLFRLPSRSFIRLFTPVGELATHPFSISVSDGNGLFTEQPVIASSDGTSLFVAPERSRPGIARVVLSTAAPDALSVALFTSHYETVGTPLAYLKTMHLTAPKVALKRRPLEAPRSYYLMEADRPTQVRVSGPGHYELQQRMIYNGDEEHRRVAYHITGKLNNQQFLDLHVATEPEMRQAISINGSYPALSRSEHSYFFIPAGAHVLTLVPTKSIYARLLRKEPSNFLFPKLNDPVSAFDYDSPVERQENGGQLPEEDPETFKSAARKRWAKTTHAHGGLVSAFAMRALAERYPGLNEVQRYTTRITGEQTFFRDLLPEQGSTSFAQQVITFSSQTLRSAEQNDLVLHPTTARLPGTGAKQAIFTELKAINDNRSSSWLRFDLPQRTLPSELRMHALVGSTPQAFGVTIDSNPEIICELRPETIRPGDEFRPTIDTISQLHTREANGLRDQLMNEDTPTDTRRVATVSLPLRHPAQRVLLRRIDQNPQPLHLSLQMRDSRPFTLTENQYLDLVRNAGSDDIGFRIVDDMLKGTFEKRAIKYQSQQEYELAAFFRPLIRQVQTLVTDYTSSVYPPPAPNRHAQKPSHQEIVDAQNRLRSAVAQRQWVVAIEQSSFLFKETSDVAKQEAAVQLIDALLQSGEQFLAELHLKGMLLHAEPEEALLANWARQRLEQLYREKNDLNGLASLYAVTLSKRITPLGCNRLTEILMDQGKSHLALRAALVPPKDYRKTELVLQATLQAKWWHLFKDTLSRVANQADRNLWLGLEKLVRGDAEKARRLFAKNSAETVGSRPFNQPKAIPATMVSETPLQEQSVFSSWEQWLQTIPVPHTWKSEPEAIFLHGGGALLYSEAQDLHMQMYRSEPERPVRFRLHGPAQLSASIRPLHPAGNSEPISGWARLQSEHELDLIPISNNLPSQQYQFASGDSQKPGMHIEYQRSFGPGIHEITLTGDALTLLVSFKIRRPTFELPAFPVVRPALPDPLSSGPSRSTSAEQANQLTCLKKDCVTLLPTEPNGTPRYFRTETINSIKNRSLAVKQPSLDYEQFHFTVERDRAAAPPRTTVARLMAKGRWQEALAQTSVKTPQTREQTLALLTYLSETQPQERMHHEVSARSLLNRYPDIRNGNTLLRRIAATSRWQQVPFVQGSAGLRLLPSLSWTPEAPSLRIRKALLQTEPVGQTVLTGSDSSILMMENHTQTRLRLTFTMAELPYLRPSPMTVACQVDDGEVERLLLGPENPLQVMSITVPPGRHRLSISIMERYTNQYLWVHFTEELPATPDQPGANPIWSTQNEERAFHVVSPEEPLIATISGPAWVRVDERVGSTVNSTYYQVTERVQNLVVRTDNGRAERLVRIFYRTTDRTINNDSMMRETIRNYNRVLPPLAHRAIDPVSPIDRVLVELPPPLPELQQSRSAALSYHRRRDLQEDDVSDEVETFVQLNVGVQKHIEKFDLYSQFSALLRRREVGGPTVGLQGDITWKIPELPLNLRVQAEALAQNPNGSSLDLSDWDASEWSGRLRISAYQYRQINLKLTHRPMLSFFGRVLSTDDGGDYEPGSLDQDIYTPYKADHKRGMQLSEYLSYRPWLDSQFSGRAVLSTNEDFNLFQPDHLRLALGWRQLLGSYQLSTGYQFTRFFADEDREEFINRNDFTLALLWDPLFNVDNWLRFHFKYRFQFETGEHTGMIGLTWYFDGNRAIFHHRPEDDPFNGLRRIRATMRNDQRESK